jgi:hypothetical protein
MAKGTLHPLRIVSCKFHRETHEKEQDFSSLKRVAISTAIFGNLIPVKEKKIRQLTWVLKWKFFQENITLLLKFKKKLLILF